MTELAPLGMNGSIVLVVLGILLALLLAVVVGGFAGFSFAGIIAGIALAFR